MEYIGIFVVGVVAGFVLAVAGSVASDKRYAKSGYVKLDGEIYKLSDPLEKNNRGEHD